FRTSINFMGCYAAVHGLRMAKHICDSTPNSNVIIVATELCSLHFQKEYIPDYVASSLLFGDGSAAALISNKIPSKDSLQLKSFYSQIAFKGKRDMAWDLSSKGFLMKLSNYVPDLVEEYIIPVVNKALEKNNMTKNDITHWCLHPGGKKILNGMKEQLGFTEKEMKYSRDVLARYGNMSSPSVLFVMKEIMNDLKQSEPANIFAVAMGPGLTMETFIAGRA
ncbi:MAG: 3-oxoacyl-[acyl-carrier-protein] synthase III C-terminal domain-containing protein, partial [Parafilimonas sp.]